MLDNDTIQAAARRLRDEQRERRARTPMPEATSAGASLDDAYQIQQALQALLLEDGLGPIVGYKIALTSAAMQKMVGIDHPLAGAVFAANVHPSPVQLPIDRFIKLGVEFEIAVKLGADLAPAADGKPHTRDSVVAAVASCMAAFELVEDRNADYDQLDAFGLIADNCWNGGVVLGATRKDWQSIDLVNAPTRLWLNGEPAGQGQAGDAMGHPLEVVAWVANLLNGQGITLAKEMIVMTGSSIVTQFPVTGDELHFAIDGLGDVRMTLT